MFCTIVEILEQAYSWFFNISNFKHNTNLNIYMLINFTHSYNKYFWNASSAINQGIWDLSISKTKSPSIVELLV